jgi:hypothetical protein
VIGCMFYGGEKLGLFWNFGKGCDSQPLEHGSEEKVTGSMSCRCEYLHKCIVVPLTVQRYGGYVARAQPETTIQAFGLFMSRVRCVTAMLHFIFWLSPALDLSYTAAKVFEHASVA